MQKRLVLVGTIIVIITIIAVIESSKRPDTASVAPFMRAPISGKPQGTPAPELAGIAGYINTPTIRIGDLIGKKVVLVDFWTYSCINCQRTMPYLNAWYQKYKDAGLEIIGVHTPEFQFEHEQKNVERAVKKFGITHPVVLDNDSATWKAYHNQYWPRKYLIDIHGNIVYDHIGEGGYEETEKKIQELLHERSTVLGGTSEISSAIAKPADAIAPLPGEVGSPEVYFGSARNEFLGNGKQFSEGTQVFTVPSLIQANTLYLGGTWTVQPEFAHMEKQGAKILFRYHAKNVYVVARGAPEATIRVLRDGKEVGRYAGADISSASTGKISDERLYHLISEQGGAGEHELEIDIESGSLDAFTFTFG